MNSRDLNELKVLPAQSRDNAAPWQRDRYVDLAVSVYRRIRGCGDYRPDPDGEDAGPCRMCGRPIAEHQEKS